MAHPPSMARLALVSAGHTVSDFAKAYGYNATYCRDVLAMRYPATEDFRNKLAEFLSRDPAEIWPLHTQEKAETATTVSA